MLSLFLLFLSTLEGIYINRFTTIDNGGLIFTGNTLGLSKHTGQNHSGSADSAGAFITTDTTQQVGLFAWRHSRLDSKQLYRISYLPAGSTVLYAN